jgi:NTE family protein
MSSGFFGFYAHCGVLAALEELRLSPAAVRGASAGALAGGLWAAGLPADEMARALTSLERREFWDPKPGFGFLRGRLFEEKVRSLLPVQTFGECRLPLKISVFDVLARKTVVLAHGELAPAMRASCAVPFMFQPVWIGGRPYLDGGILDRPGLHGHPDVPTLYHHLRSTSRWRKNRGKSVVVPQAPQMRTLIVDGLPRVNPWRLAKGKEAFARARDAALAELSKPWTR